ncbi:MAG: hypothetical protein CMM93_03980 [Rickettsiales bacterium]|nr:hypothetical protein [Rickettsiales bacterium]
MHRNAFSYAGWAQSLILLFAILLAHKVTWPLIHTALPAFPLIIAMYYWALFRDHYGYVWAVAIGALLQDVILGLPLGTSAVAILSAHVILLWVRRRILMDHFVIIWIGFLPVILWCFLLMAIVGSWAGGTQTGPWLGSVLDDMVGTWLLFPLAYRLFHWFTRRRKKGNA